MESGEEISSQKFEGDIMCMAAASSGELLAVGGSALIASLLAIGVVLSLARSAEAREARTE